MFRQPQSGNWADACDEDEERVVVPQEQSPIASRAASEQYSSEQPSSRPVAASKAPAASNYWQTRAQQQQAARPAPAPQADNSSFRRGDDRGGHSFDRRDERGDYNDRRRDDRGDFNERRRDDRGDYGDRRRDYDDRVGGNRRYDDSSRFDRQGGAGGAGRSYDRQDSNSSFGARGGGYGRDGHDSQRPAPSGRWGQVANAPRHEGFVTHVREDGGFGFLHCLELKQDVFFHESEVPARASTDEVAASEATPVVHVHVGDELSFELTVNPRNGKESATHIQRLPKGSIVLEDVADEVTHGVVTKSLPPKHKPSSHHPHSSSRQAADATGTIDVVVAATSDDAAPTPLRKPIVRFNADSFPTSSHPPRVGDDVQFRIAIHRQTGLKRAVDLTVTLSAAAKREAAIEAALSSLAREMGVVTSIKGHSGTIKCLSRLQDATFAISKEDKRAVAEGDSVSFYIVPDDLQGPDADRTAALGNAKNATSGRRLLTAIRLEKLDEPVLFEAVVATNVQGTIIVAPKDLSRASGYHHDSKQRGNSSNTNGVGKIQPLEAASDEDAKAPTTVQVQWSEVSYPAKAGDVVTYDVLEDFRRGSKFAVHVQWHELHPDGREVGTVSSLKDDFGFIKCVDRHADAYFRVSDVVPAGSSASHLTLRQGAEVSFDVVPNVKQGGGKPDGIRAARVQVLPKHTIVWEVTVHADAKGVVAAVPVSASSYNRKDGSSAPVSHSSSNADGRITFTTSTCPLEPFPALRRDVQTTFDVEDAPEEVALVIKQLPPTQRSALLLYAKLVGLVTSDEGKSGRDVKVVLPANSTRPDWTAAVAPHAADAEFSPENLQDVRYEPQVGDEVSCTIVRTKRGQHLVAKTIVAVKTVSKATITGEGWVTLVKAEGYGFIESSDGESVFFHVTDVADKAVKLREGDEVTFAIKNGADRKKKAVAIVKVPQGTLPPKEVRTVDAVVVRASHRQKSSGGHHKKHQQHAPPSTAGKLKTRAATADVAAAADTEEKDDHEDDDGGRHGWVYHVEDQVDPAVVLRPGDVVTCQVVGKSKQATQVALVSSVAKTGIVELVNVNGGTIVVTADEAEASGTEERVTYLNKSLLWHGGHHGALGVGDKVEFAIAQPNEDKPAMATYIVRLEGVDRKGAGVNSSLRRVLKENGGGVATSHRMAKGPDGTKGFASGWQADVGAA